MDKKTKILLAILIVFTLASIGMTYYRTMIAKDFYTEQSEEEIVDEELIEETPYPIE